jgi:type I restriction enzyme S subunit
VIEGLKEYPQYKDSGLRPIGPIPRHWIALRAKHLFHEIDHRSASGKETLLSVSHISGVRRRSETNATMFLAKSNIGHKRCEPNDLVINTMWAWMGALGVSRISGIVSPAYGVYRPRRDSTLLPAYIDHVLRTPGYVAEYTMRSSGVHSSRLRLYPEFFLRIPILVPPPDEQVAIVRFLGHATRRIDRFIRAKRKLIALLNQQKQAIVHSAVTRGLDPKVSMKDSGIAWLPRIPKTWTTSRLKFEATDIVDCLHATPSYSDDGEFPAIRTADVEPGRLRLWQARRVSAAQFARWTARLAPREGDILYSREGERFGMAAVVPKDVRLCISQRMMVFRIRPATCSEYIMWQLNCPHVYAQASVQVIGSTSPHVNVEQIRNFQLALPPRAEQEQIARDIRTGCAQLDGGMAQAEREISLIREYRTRLVADVVTGQLDVRAAAASLPDDEPEAANEELARDLDQEEDGESEDVAE